MAISFRKVSSEVQKTIDAAAQKLRKDGIPAQKVADKLFLKRLEIRAMALGVLGYSLPDTVDYFATAQKPFTRDLYGLYAKRRGPLKPDEKKELAALRKRWGGEEIEGGFEVQEDGTYMDPKRAVAVFVRALTRKVKDSRWSEAKQSSETFSNPAGNQESPYDFDEEVRIKWTGILDTLTASVTTNTSRNDLYWEVVGDRGQEKYPEANGRVRMDSIEAVEASGAKAAKEVEKFFKRLDEEAASTATEKQLKQFTPPPKMRESSAVSTGSLKEAIQRIRKVPIEQGARKGRYYIPEEGAELIEETLNALMEDWEPSPMETLGREGSLVPEGYRYEWTSPEGMRLILRIYNYPSTFYRVLRSGIGDFKILSNIFVSSTDCPRQAVEVASQEQIHRQRKPSSRYSPSHEIAYTSLEKAVSALYKASRFLLLQDAAEACNTVLEGSSSPRARAGQNPDRYAFHPTTGKVFTFPYHG